MNSDYSQDYNSSKPLGFIKAMLPYPQNGERPNPVYEIKGLEGRQIELRVKISFIIFLYFENDNHWRI